LILDVLLQILSAARFTLAIGETLDLRNYIVVANSNLVRGQRIDDESPHIDHADSIEWMRVTRIASVGDCSWKVDQQTRKLWFAESAGRIRSAIEKVFFERKVGKSRLWTICPVEYGSRHTQVEHLAELLQSATTPRFDPQISRRTGADRRNGDAALIVAFRRLAPFLTGCSARTSWVFLITSGTRSVAGRGSRPPGKD
jgi:hypothetical protein